MQRPLITAFTAIFLTAFALVTFTAFGSTGMSWKPDRTNLLANATMQIRLQLVDGAGRPVEKSVTVVSSRIDMGPDNMSTMTAPLRLLPSKALGLVVFETNLYAPGRWALSLSANVAGEPRPVSGSVAFTATMKSAEAPAAPRKVRYYRNAMGLPDTSPVPKKDAMGMDYIPVYSDQVSTVPGEIRLTTEKIQRAGVRTDVVKRMALSNAVARRERSPPTKASKLSWRQSLMVLSKSCSSQRPDRRSVPVSR